MSDTPPIAQPVADCIGFRRSIPESATDTAVPHANPNFNPASRSIVRFLAAHGTGPRLFMGILIPAHRPSVAPPVSRHPPLPPPASRVSRSPDSARQAAKPQSPQRLLAAYKYPVCLAACICEPCWIRFVTNARPKGPAAGNTASNLQNNDTTKPTIRPACPRRLRHYLGGAL
ncbi:hypothetical protein BPORC_1841 [Bifidobacterium porcinum]|nr:hypothetical protein BPORC_1841 [Bifidobacterium porcinum]